MHVVLCAFDDRDTALRAIARLIDGGIARDDVHLQPEHDLYREMTHAVSAEAGCDGARWSWSGMFAPLAQQGDVPGAPGTYRDAVRRGSTVVVVHVDTAEESLDIARQMSARGAFDVEPRRTGRFAGR